MVMHPAVVALTNRREEFISRKRQAANGVDLVDKDDQRSGLADKDGVSDSSEESLARPQSVFRKPERVERILQVQLPSHLREQAVVPLFRCEILPYGGQVQGYDSGSALG